MLDTMAHTLYTMVMRCFNIYNSDGQLISFVLYPKGSTITLRQVKQDMVFGRGLDLSITIVEV